MVWKESKVACDACQSACNVLAQGTSLTLGAHLLREQGVARLQAAGFVSAVLLTEGALELAGAHA